MIKVMTFNIRCTNGMNLDLKKGDWRRVADVMAPVQADVYGVEEACINHPYSKGVDVPARLGEFLNLHYHFAKTISYPRWDEGQFEYGVAAFSRPPLSLVEEIPLPVPEKKEKRVALVARIEAPHPFYFIVTHFSYAGEYPGDDAHRVDAVRLITDAVVRKRYAPAILVGDFNAKPDSACLETARREWTVCNDSNPELSWPADKPERLIDYICFYPRHAFDIGACRVIPNATASDHRPVVAELHPRG